MAEQQQTQEPSSNTRRRWADVAVWSCVVLASSALVVIVGEQALERHIAACSSSRAILVDRLIIGALIVAVLAILAGIIALMGRSTGRIWAILGIVVASFAIWIGMGGYRCSITTYIATRA